MDQSSRRSRPANWNSATEGNRESWTVRAIVSHLAYLRLHYCHSQPCVSGSLGLSVFAQQRREQEVALRRSCGEKMKRLRSPDVLWQVSVRPAVSDPPRTDKHVTSRVCPWLSHGKRGCILVRPS